MNWLILLYSLTLGYAPIYQSVNIIPEGNNHIQNENVYFIDFQVEVEILKYGFIGGGVKTYIQPGENDFYPIEADYPFKTGLRYKNLEIGYQRLCIHPVETRNIEPIGHTFGGYEEFYIRVSNEF